ncbi:MAG: hypothetical protein KAS61_01765 [Spirochaetes bacterium]|nr:hypothetical protein [Spirochaetota bacterium]
MFWEVVNSLIRKLKMRIPVFDEKIRIPISKVREHPIFTRKYGDSCTA